MSRHTIADKSVYSLPLRRQCRRNALALPPPQACLSIISLNVSHRHSTITPHSCLHDTNIPVANPCLFDSRRYSLRLPKPDHATSIRPPIRWRSHHFWQTSHSTPRPRRQYRKSRHLPGRCTMGWRMAAERVAYCLRRRGGVGRRCEAIDRLVEGRCG